MRSRVCARATMSRPMTGQFHSFVFANNLKACDGLFSTWRLRVCGIVNGIRYNYGFGLPRMYIWQTQKNMADAKKPKGATTHPNISKTKGSKWISSIISKAGTLVTSVQLKAEIDIQRKLLCLKKLSPGYCQSFHPAPNPYTPFETKRQTNIYT